MLKWSEIPVLNYKRIDLDDLAEKEADCSDEETTVEKKANTPTDDFHVRREFVRKMREFGFLR